MHVIGLDNMNDYYSAKLKKDRVELLKVVGVDVVKGDVCDDEILEQIIKDHKIDRVIHLAAQAGVRFSLESPHSYTRNNVDCFVTLLEQYVKAGLQKKPLVYASSSSVYGLTMMHHSRRMFRMWIILLVCMLLPRDRMNLSPILFYPRKN